MSKSKLRGRKLDDGDDDYVFGLYEWSAVVLGFLSLLLLIVLLSVLL